MPLQEKNASDSTSNTNTLEELPPSLTFVDLGVWRVILERPNSYFVIPGKQTLQLWRDTIISISGILLQFFHDLLRIINPWTFAAFLIAHLWTGIDGALRLHLESRALDTIERSFTSGSPDLREIGLAITQRVLLLVVSSVIYWFMYRIQPVIKNAIKLHFQKRILEANLNQDFTTCQDNSGKINADASEAFYCFSEVLDTADLIFSVITQVGFVLNFSRNQEQGFVFAMLCIAKPIMSAIDTKSLWDKTFVAHITNAAYNRSMAMFSLATGSENKQEVLTCGLEDYIAKEYTKASNECEGIPDDYPSTLYGLRNTPFRDVCIELMGELPTIYYVASCLSQPSKFSISTLAMLHQTATSLRWTFDRIASQNNNFAQYMNKIKSIYDSISAKHENKEELFTYPPSGKDTNEGMNVEFEDVSFHYPGTPSNKLVLKSLSFTLPSSSLVVIVGANGSGKSTLVKLLTNLYKPSTGTIYLDSKPSTTYISSSLFHYLALLTQDHSIFPVPMLENITMGDPDCEEGEERTRRGKESARLGGAFEAIEKLCVKDEMKEGKPKEDGWDKVLHPVQSVTCSHWPMPEGQLKDVMDKIEKQLDLSGGEKQRVAASRTFMRLLSGRTKLVVVDEPTSAMDPEGELQLFNNLRSMRHGKTMVFVTHRFGHLTKHADLILCMKDGELVESGSHRELIEKKGEYHKLYNIQATAFTEDVVTPTNPPSSRTNTLNNEG
ncbi:P-loop containing nucleoside triphosphate hydrolase protein [Abortiporus biennis]|nr:P-loop containing nucleoside triphosphate hydrolase protein [Abortiporus biennis]